jgi:phosphate acetyltransferase
MKEFLEKTYIAAKSNPKKIVFAEGEDIRVLKAVQEIIKLNLAIPFIIGDKAKLEDLIKQENLDLGNAEIIDPNQSALKEKVINEYKKIIKEKGKSFSTNDESNALLPNYFATLLVAINYVDGMITGSLSSTGDSIRPALQIIPTKEHFQRVSGAFLIELENRILIFADTAVTVEPDAHDLVDIAEDCVETAKSLGIEPKIAFLSFSTKGSASDPSVEKMRRATKIFQEKHPNIICDGELQADAALVPEIAERKVGTGRDLSLKGDANILIFPDLNAANISYKLVERLAKAKAVGPILQGLTKPINDLSRGCSVQDIIDLTAFTVVEAQTDPRF